MDHKEEQANELEALESIYYGDLIVIENDPECKFTIPIKTEEYEADSADGFTCNLTFTYTPKYPDEPLAIEIDEDDIDCDYKLDLLEHLNDQVNENLGTVMVFTLVSAAQEWINLKWDAQKKIQTEELRRKKKQEEEAEQKKFEGTCVTVESFMTWKRKFEDEMGITKKREQIEKEGKKLTGKELFLQDNTLNESDLQFLDDGEMVKVDESLFQDLDDLDFEDDSGSDDPDFNPNECSD